MIKRGCHDTLLYLSPPKFAYVSSVFSLRTTQEKLKTMVKQNLEGEGVVNKMYYDSINYRQSKKDDRSPCYMVETSEKAARLSRMST